MLWLFPFFFPFSLCFSSLVQFLLAEGTRDLQHYVNLRIANFVRPLQFRTNVYLYLYLLGQTARGGVFDAQYYKTHMLFRLFFPLKLREKKPMAVMTPCLKQGEASVVVFPTAEWHNSP